MGEMITDEMINAFGVMGEPETLVAEIKRRYGDIADRTSGGFNFVDTADRLKMVADLRTE